MRMWVEYKLLEQCCEGRPDENHSCKGWRVRRTFMGRSSYNAFVASVLTASSQVRLDSS